VDTQLNGKQKPPVAEPCARIRPDPSVRAMASGRLHLASRWRGRAIAMATIHKSSSRPVGVSADDRIRPIPAPPTAIDGVIGFDG